MARSTRSGSLGRELPRAAGTPGRVSPVKSAESARMGLATRRTASMAKSEAAKSLQRFVRQEYWNGLSAGEVVRVAGHPARGRHWRFRAHVTNTSNGATWVEVALVDGPPPSRRPSSVAVEADALSATEKPRVEKVRSFEPELITPRWRQRSRSRLLGRPVMMPAAEAPAGDALAARQPSLF